MTSINPQRFGACFDRGRNLPLRVLALIGLIAVTGLPAVGAETNQPPAPVPFRVGMSSACFRNVNRNDAVAAYRVFLEATGRQYGNVFKAETEVFDDAPTFETALRQEPKHLAVIEEQPEAVRRDVREFNLQSVPAKRGVSHSHALAQAGVRRPVAAATSRRSARPRL